MKTGRSKAEVVFKDMKSNLPSRQTLKKAAPGIKTEAFGDKENANDKTHTVISGTESKLKTVEPTISESKLKTVEPTASETKDKLKRSAAHIEIIGEKKVQESDSCEEKTQITADDLTNPAGPSENYWKLLAEQRRKALEETLIENEALHQKCSVLEAENETLKQALQEATEVISVLNEIVEEDKETDQSEGEPKDENSTNVKSSPKEKASSAEDAFGNDSTVYEESDDSDKE